jgi:hypothetical protein
MMGTQSISVVEELPVAADIRGQIGLRRKEDIGCDSFVQRDCRPAKLWSCWTKGREKDEISGLLAGKGDEYGTGSGL